MFQEPQGMGASMVCIHHVSITLPHHLRPLVSHNPLIIPYIKLQLHNLQVAPSVKRKKVQIIISNELYDVLIEFHNRYNLDDERLSKDALVLTTKFTSVDNIHGPSEQIWKEDNRLNHASLVKHERKQKILTLGALRKEKKFIVETIEYAFTGDSTIHGLLVHGISGTGKTQLVRSILVESFPNIKVVELKPTHFTSRQYGRNEHRMRDLFSKAMKYEKAIVLCDEMDVCMCQQSSGSENIESNRLMRALASELEKLHSDFSGISSNVIFIGITNKLEAISSELRRFGRIDREIELQIPSEGDRVDIINAIMKDLKYDVLPREVKYLVSRTHGFLGADLRTLCQLYIMTQNEKLPELQKDRRLIDTESIEHVLAQVKPSAIRHVQIQIPNVKWSDIGGMSLVKQQLKESIEWQLTHRDAFDRMGIRPPKGILLYGPPGCSKTMMAKALATESRMNFLSVRGPELFSKWVGESERAVKKLFERARSASPCIIFFDEIDGLAAERGSSNSNVGDRVLSQLLAELDGIKSLERVTLVAATNRPDLIDKALLRPGRIDRMVYVSPPDFESRQSILRIYLRNMQHNLTDQEIEACSQITNGYSGAEIAALCKEAAYIALNEYLEKGEGDICVTSNHLEKAKEKVPSRLTDEMMQFYEDFSSTHQKLHS